MVIIEVDVHILLRGVANEQSSHMSILVSVTNMELSRCHESD